MRPFALALGKINEVGDGLRRVFFKQAANDGSFRGLKDGIGSRGTAHGFLFSFRGQLLILTGRTKSRLPTAGCRKNGAPVCTLFRIARAEVLHKKNKSFES